MNEEPVNQELSAENYKHVQLSNDATKTVSEVLELVSGVGLSVLEIIAPKSVQVGSATVFGAVQAAVKGKLLGHINNGLKALKEKGRLIEISASDISPDSVTELFDFVDSVKTSDEERFKAIRNLFLFGFLKSTNDQERFLAHRFMKITKSLDGEDILILRACYELYLSYRNALTDVYTTGADGWAMRVADRVGHKISYLVLNKEAHLQQLGFIGKRIHSDQSGIESPKQSRLTDLGLIYCEFLKKTDGELVDI